MKTSRCRRSAANRAVLLLPRLLLTLLLAGSVPPSAGAQTITNRGFVDATAWAFPQKAPNDATVEAVWVPRFTPSRLPLLGQRWTVPPDHPVILIASPGVELASGSQFGVRWAHAGAIEYSLSVFDGFNHLPTVEAAFRSFPG